MFVQGRALLLRTAVLLTEIRKQRLVTRRTRLRFCSQKHAADLWRTIRFIIDFLSILR